MDLNGGGVYICSWASRTGVQRSSAQWHEAYSVSVYGVIGMALVIADSRFSPLSSQWSMGRGRGGHTQPYLVHAHVPNSMA